MNFKPMPISAEKLLSVVRNYWRSDHEFDGKLERSPETERFQDLWEQELKKLDQWRALRRERAPLRAHQRSRAADGWGVSRLTLSVETAVRLGPPALVG